MHKDIGINEYLDHMETKTKSLEVKGLNIPDRPSSITLPIWADDFINVCKLLSLTATMSGAVLLFGKLQNTGRAVGAAGKTEAHECYRLIVWGKWIHWDEIEPQSMISVG
jgi:hypothetical protein